MREAIEREFALSIENNCIEVNSKKDFYIKDFDDSKCEIVQKTTNFNVEIVNKSKKSLHFLAVDNCIYTERDEKRCDCAVFNENNFFFIEIKDGKPRNRKLHRKRAIEQLEQSIIDFRDKEIPLEGHFLYAYISFRSKSRIAKTNKSETVDFWTKYNVRLMEGNKIIVTQ